MTPFGLVQLRTGLGKGEVHSSILCGSTSHSHSPPAIRGFSLAPQPAAASGLLRSGAGRRPTTSA